MKIKEMKSNADDICEIMTLLSNRSRLMILCLLSEGEKSVGGLAEAIRSRDTAVSQQLARLRHEKLVSTRREGNQIIYTLADDRVRTMIRLIQRLFGHQLRHPGDG